MKAPTQLETGETGRIYIAAKEVAAVCQISEYHLDTHLRPDAWGSPHDFKINASGVMLYALESLPQLADEIETRGYVPTATALRAWTVTQIEAALRRKVKLPTVNVTTRTTYPATAAEVADVSRAPWLNEWERDHES